MKAALFCGCGNRVPPVFDNGTLIRVELSVRG